MKKILAVLMVVLLGLCTGCGGEAAPAASGAASETALEDVPETVTLVLPVLTEDSEKMTEEVLARYAEKNDFIRAEKTEEGAVRVEMTGERFIRLRDDMYGRLENGLRELVSEDGAFGIRGIEWEKNFSVIRVQIDRKAFDIAGEPTMDMIGALVHMYHASVGMECTTSVTMLDAETGDVLSEGVYPQE